ncbi:LuxR C-terminal-related transcriptional regulator [Kitasatospora sp. NPDC101447]|uniref:LuxR C-terminal-related transcriptional regulator n=1 Tax=Kitasatospora sp. NPDC101447 TaxID=3364102 RepID=UPI00381617BD
MTERQHLSLVRTAGGSTIAETGAHLGLAASTVEAALARARRTAGARNLAHLAAIGVRAGLVPLHVPRHSPGSLTARRLEVMAQFAEGLTTYQVAAALGITPSTVSGTQTIVYRQLGVTTLPAAITMLCSLGQLNRSPYCTRAACVATRQQQAPAGPQGARDAALRWAEGLAEAARERAEHQRLGRQLAHVTAQLAGSRAELETMLQQVQRAGEEAQAVRQIWAETFELRRQVRDLAAAVRPAVDTAQDAHRLATSTRTAVEETLQAAKSLIPAFHDLEAGRRELAAGWRALDAARAQTAPGQAEDGTLPVRVPGRAAIPAEARPWRRT